MKVLREREEKGYEVQFYKENGDGLEVMQFDTVEELAEGLAHYLWHTNSTVFNPTVYKDGMPWGR